MSGWEPSWQAPGTRDSGSSWKPRAWWGQEPSLLTTSEWHWVPVSGHDEPGDHRAWSRSHDNCFIESIPLNSPLGKLLLFPFLMSLSWQSLTPVSQADLNTYLFGAYFIKGKVGKTGREIGRRWTGADEAHAFSFRRRAISLRGDGYQASNLFQETCVLSRSAGQACGSRESVHVLCLTLHHALSWPQGPFSRALSSNLLPGSTASICTVTMALYMMLVFDIYWLLGCYYSQVTETSGGAKFSSLGTRTLSPEGCHLLGTQPASSTHVPCRDPHRILPSLSLCWSSKPFPFSAPPSTTGWSLSKDQP